MGVLGNDRDLWLLEGGHPQGDAFSLVAADVKSFQLEREWVSYVEDGAQKRLMVARIETLRQESPRFVPVAKGVVDFEGEVSVQTTDGFPARLQLAVVVGDEALPYGEAAEPTEFALGSVGSSIGGGAREVHWAGGRSTSRGHGLAVVRLRPDPAHRPGRLERPLGHRGPA